MCIIYVSWPTVYRYSPPDYSTHNPLHPSCYFWLHLQLMQVSGLFIYSSTSVIQIHLGFYWSIYWITFVSRVFVCRNCYRIPDLKVSVSVFPIPSFYLIFLVSFCLLFSYLRREFSLEDHTSSAVVLESGFGFEAVHKTIFCSLGLVLNSLVSALGPVSDSVIGLAKCFFFLLEMVIFCDWFRAVI